MKQESSPIQRRALARQKRYTQRIEAHGSTLTWTDRDQKKQCKALPEQDWNTATELMGQPLDHSFVGQWTIVYLSDEAYQSITGGALLYYDGANYSINIVRAIMQADVVIVRVLLLVASA